MFTRLPNLLPKSVPGLWGYMSYKVAASSSMNVNFHCKLQVTDSLLWMLKNKSFKGRTALLKVSMSISLLISPETIL